MGKMCFMLCAAMLLVVAGCSKIDREPGAATSQEVMVKMDQALRENNADLMLSCFHQADHTRVKTAVNALLEARLAALTFTKKVEEFQAETQANEIKFVVMEEFGIMFSPPGTFSRAVIKEEKTNAYATVIGLHEPLALVKSGDRWGLDANAILHGKSTDFHVKISQALKTAIEKLSKEDFSKLDSDTIMTKLRNISNEELRWVYKELDQAGS